MQNPDCHLQPWKAAQCQKFRATFEQIVEKVTEVDSLLRECASEPGLSHELQMRFLDILTMVNEIPPVLGDLGFDYVGTGRHHKEVLEALKAPQISVADLAALKDLKP